MSPLRNDRGVALVITLLVVAILAITVLEFAFSVHVDAHMGRNALNGLQATLLARSGINGGEAVLAQDEENQFDSYTEDWGDVELLNSLFLLPPNMLLRVRIVDEMGKLNINLTRPLRPGVECQNYLDKPPAATYRMWITALQRIDPAVGEAVDNYWGAVCERYGLLRQAGQAGGTPAAGTTPTAAATAGPETTPTPQDPNSLFRDFPSLDDAAAMGIPPSVLRRLRPYVTALPTAAVGGVPAKVNANTAPQVVLQAIIEDADQVKDLISRREEAGLRDADLGFLSQAGTQSAQQQGAPATDPRKMLGTRSSFFLIRASAIINANPVTGRGGVRRSASMLVQRTVAPGRPGAPVGATGSTAAGGTAQGQRWTLKQLDWQKEGGAALFTERSEDELAGDGALDPSTTGTGW